jgi:hypothetical protein
LLYRALVGMTWIWLGADCGPAVRVSCGPVGATELSEQAAIVIAPPIAAYRIHRFMEHLAS